MKIGHNRMSTTEHNAYLQRDERPVKGCEKIGFGIVSGVKLERAQLQKHKELLYYALDKVTMWLLAARARERVGDSPSNNKKEAKKLQNKVAIVEAAKP